MSAFSSCRAAPRATRDPRRGGVDVCVGREDEHVVRTGAVMDTVTQYAAPIAGAAAGLLAGVLAFGGRMLPTVGLGAVGGVAGYFLGKPATPAA